MILEKCFSRAVKAFKVWASKGITAGRKFSKCVWWLKQVTNIPVLFQNQSMRYVWHFKFLKIFHCHLLKKCFKKAVEAFKVWTSKGITAGRKFSNEFWWLKQFTNISVLFQKQSMRHVWHFKFLRIFHGNLMKKFFKKAVEAFEVWASKGMTTERNFLK